MKSPSLYRILILLFVFFCIKCQRELFFNRPPIANAGPDKSITLPTDSVILDGSGSSSYEGKINSYTWRKLSGPAGWEMVNLGHFKTVVHTRSAGIYFFELKVTDTQNQAGRDTVQVIVSRNDTTHILPGKQVKLLVLEYGTNQILEGATVRICLSPSGFSCSSTYSTYITNVNGICNFNANQYYYGCTSRPGYWGLDYNSCFITYFNDDHVLALSGIHTSDSVVVQMVPQTYVTLHVWDSSGIGNDANLVRTGNFNSCGYYPSESVSMRQNIDTTFPYLVFGNANNLFTILGPPDSLGIQNPYYQNLFFLPNGGNGTYNIIY